MTPSDKPLINFVIDPDLLKLIDDFRFRERFESRADCIRWLLWFALAQDPKTQEGKVKHGRSPAVAALKMACSGAAHYRGERAERYPEDARNASATDALGTLEFLAGMLREDDPILVMLDEIPPDDVEIYHNPTTPDGENMSSLDRFGFDDTNLTIEGCRSELLEHATAMVECYRVYQQNLDGQI